VGAAATLVSSKATAAEAAKLTYGPVYNAWVSTDLGAIGTTTTSYKSAYSAVMQFAPNDTGTAFKVCAVLNRIMFDAA